MTNCVQNYRREIIVLIDFYSINSLLILLILISLSLPLRINTLDRWSNFPSARLRKTRCYLR